MSRLVGHERLAVLGADGAIDVEVGTLHGDVGVLVIGVARHFERRHVLEVNARVGQCVHADEARLVLRRERVDAQRGRHLIVGALAGERDAADHVVALGIGLAVEAQLRVAGDGSGEGRVGLLLAVVLVGHTRRLRVVVGKGQGFYALVHRPVELQVGLCADEQAVVVAHDVVVGQCLRPQADIVEVAREGMLGGVATVAAKGHAVGACPCNRVGGQRLACQVAVLVDGAHRPARSVARLAITRHAQVGKVAVGDCNTCGKSCCRAYFQINLALAVSGSRLQQHGEVAAAVYNRRAVG